MISLITRDIPEPKVLKDDKGRRVLAVPRIAPDYLETLKLSEAFKSLPQDEQEAMLWKFQFEINLKEEIARSS